MANLPSQACPPSFCHRWTVLTLIPSWPANSLLPAATCTRPSPPPNSRTTARIAAGVNSTSVAATRAS